MKLINALYICLLLFVFLTVGPAEAQQTISVGIYQDEPVVFIDSNGNVKGIYVDVLEHIAQFEKWNIQYVPGTWTQSLERLQTGEIDILISIAKTPERSQQYDFTTETPLLNWGRVYARKDAEIESFLDLTGKTIAGVKEDIHYLNFRFLSEKLEMNINFIEVDNNYDVLKSIEEKKVFAGIVSRLYGDFQESNFDVQKTFIDFLPVEIHFASLKDKNQHLISTIDSHFKRLTANKSSIYYRSLVLWTEGVRFLSFPGWLKPIWLISGIVAVLIITGIFNILLRRQVKLKTNKLKETIEEKHKIESELKIAHDIQMEILPRTFPPFPGRTEFDIFATLKPAKEVGGDFYDFYFIDNDHLCVVIGDVSGKGVPAALFMSQAKTLIKSIAIASGEPDRIFTSVNQELSANNESCMFVTSFMGILDIRSGIMTYTNAGHNQPLILRKNNTVEFIKTDNCPALGLDEDSIYFMDELILSPGDIIYLYTDGITEAFNEQNEMFSEERLLNLLSRKKQSLPKEIIDSIVIEAENFSGNRSQSDDITMLALKFIKQTEHHELRIILENDIKETSKLFNALNIFWDTNKIENSDALHDSKLTLEEIFTNIVKYAFNDNMIHQVVISMSVSKRAVQFIITDDGKPFNPMEFECTDIDKPVEEREIGGMGIVLAINLMDKVEYYYKNRKNTLVLTMKI